MQHEPFSTHKARRSLNYFALGKVISAVLGLAMLVVLVRCMTASEYGVYIALIAGLEIALLVSSAGSYSIAQRYITEARLTRHIHQLPRLIWQATLFRMATLTLFCAALVPWLPQLMGLASVEMTHGTALAYLVFVVLEGIARYIEMVFEALLEQWRTQLSTILRNGIRLAAITVFLVRGEPLTLATLVLIECGASLIGAIFAVMLVLLYLRGLRQTAVLSTDGSDASPQFSIRRMLGYALPHYIAQSVFQMYSPDAVKIITMRMLGALEAAAFGFAHALTFVLQKYMPAQLLIGLIRPLFVARRADGAKDDELGRMANFVMKVNNFLLVPAVVFFALHGSAFASWLSGGKQTGAGTLLPLLVGLLLIQGLHLVLGMICAAMEDGTAILLATVLATPGLALGIAASRPLGAAGMALGLWVSELIWCTTLWLLLARRAFVLRVDWIAALKLLNAGGLASLASLSATHTPGLASWHTLVQMAFQLGVIGAAYLLACFVLKPFNERERRQINNMLPLPVFKF